MACSEFEHQGYLMLSGELEANERRAFKAHLKSCLACKEAWLALQETWQEMNALPLETPSAETRKAILHLATTREKTPSLFQKIRSWFTVPQPGLAWGLSTAVVAIIVMFVVVRPFGLLQRDQVILEEQLAWDDSFISNVDWMEQEMDRLSSGVLLVNYSTTEEQSTASEFSDEWSSPMTEDLDWIRDKVEGLVKDMYGI